ncbi:MAG: N-acetylmuramoyl-L-alanine amidase [Clostridia bacterium]|nr:N-acetylmuramoyl-L-alanine amidase [Clostridia bacterium]
MKRGFRLFYLLLCAIIVISLVGVWFFSGIHRQTASVHSRVFTVVVDAGHGGIDGGAEGNQTSVKESDLNLEIARLLKAKLEGAGITVVMTRNSYGGLYGTTTKGFKKRDLEKRVKIINSAKADVMVSIHLNHFSSPGRRGATVFFAEGSSRGEDLAKCIQKHFNTLSSQTREFSANKGDYYLLNEAICPSAICECGFLSNQEDERLLLTKEYKDEVAQKIFYGIIEFLME